ncbi:hypothetical protein JNK13_00980 [bacterium]|nr:hypothetical protein [bacterium]
MSIDPTGAVLERPNNQEVPTDSAQQQGNGGEVAMEGFSLEAMLEQHGHLDVASLEKEVGALEEDIRRAVPAITQEMMRRPAVAANVKGLEKALKAYDQGEHTRETLLSLLGLGKWAIRITTDPKAVTESSANRKGNPRKRPGHGKHGDLGRVSARAKSLRPAVEKLLKDVQLKDSDQSPRAQKIRKLRSLWDSGKSGQHCAETLELEQWMLKHLKPPKGARGVLLSNKAKKPGGKDTKHPGREVEEALTGQDEDEPLDFNLELASEDQKTVYAQGLALRKEGVNSEDAVAGFTAALTVCASDCNAELLAAFRAGLEKARQGGGSEQTVTG